MGNSPSNQSPLTSKAMNSPLISNPRSLAGHTATPRSPSVRSRASPSRAAEPVDVQSAPPPYTPVADPQQVPPAVPPREARDIRRVSSTVVSPTSESRPHRRTVSTSHTSHPAHSRRTPGSTSLDTLAPGDGVGGFLTPPQEQSPGSNFTGVNSTATRHSVSLAHSVQGDPTSTRTDSTTLAALSSQPSPGSQSSSASTHRPAPPPTAPTPRNPTRRKSKENPLDLLRRFDTVIIVDDSSSMEGPLWMEAREALAGIADAAAQYDTTGIDLHFLNDRKIGKNLKSSQDVRRIFDSVSPSGITPTGEKLEELLLDYLLRFEAAEFDKPKPVNFVILTDGAPTDDPESVIVTAAKRLDAQHAPVSQVGIQFVQLGSDKEATEALQELDDELANRHDTRDMVDTTLFTGQQLTAELLGKILLGGVNRRVDKKGFQS